MFCLFLAFVYLRFLLLNGYGSLAIRCRLAKHAYADKVPEMKMTLMQDHAWLNARCKAAREANIIKPTPAISISRMFYLLCSLLFATSTLVAADLSGDWEFAAKYLGDFNYARVTLKIEEGKLTGTLNELKLEGSLKGGELTFSATRPNGKHFGDFTGKVSGDQLEGTGEWADDRKITWSAKRAAIPPHTPRVHDFEPKEFHRVFSDAIAPVLHIFPGDTVRTWTVDAGGVDSNNVRR